jgi:hypothetical protein
LELINGKDIRKLNMKITINNKEHNWYIQDLDCYSEDFLKSIILDLYNTQSQETKAEANIIPNRIHSPLKDDGRLQDKILTRAEGTIDTSADTHSDIKDLIDKDYITISQDDVCVICDHPRSNHFNKGKECNFHYGDTKCKCRGFTL